MGSRTGLHQLSNGLYVSGRPEQLKERQPTVALCAVPYTGGDVKNSGELGKMYGIDFSSGDHSSPQVPRKSPSSSFSGPIMTPIQPTGLLTSGPLGSSVARRSGPLEPTASFSKTVYGSAVTSLSEEAKLRFRVSRLAMWVVLLLLLMTLVVGAFLMVAVKKAVILMAVAGILAPIFVFLLWNLAYKQKGFMGFLKRFPDSELRGAIDGHYVKVTGVATCGSIPLETSFQKIERCIYVSTELYEYRGWGGKPANSRHCFFSWGQRHSAKYVADFYISDFQSGLRALVKTGYGAKVAPFVTPSTVVDITKDNRELSPNFLKWLADRKLSSDDRIMRLKEGYIQEGSTVSVMGVVRRHDNVLMIVPPEEPVSTGVQWTRCLLPTNIEGLVLTSDDCQNADVIPV
nr:uncharacterized membrane protein At1g16860-like [Ipomoea batatas]